MITDQKYIVTKDGATIHGMYERNFREQWYSNPLQMPVGTVVTYRGGNIYTDHWGNSITPDGRTADGKLSPIKKDGQVDMSYFKSCRRASDPSERFVCHPIREMTKKKILKEYKEHYDLKTSWNKGKLIGEVMKKEGLPEKPIKYLRQIEEKADQSEKALKSYIRKYGYDVNGSRCVCIDKNNICNNKSESENKPLFWENETLEFMRNKGLSKVKVIPDLFPLMDYKNKKYDSIEIKKHYGTRLMCLK